MLNKMESPGCEYQKYLRSFIGVKANSFEVYNVIKGVAFLPETFESCFYSLKKADFTPELEGAWYIMNYRKTNKYHFDQLPPMIINYDMEYLERYMRLLSWVTKSQLHLRVIMAQYDQLAVRCFQSCRYHSRCMEALFELVQMRNGDVDNIRLWA